ncbi:MAG: AMP-binding protein [Nodosilinea sp.]
MGQTLADVLRKRRGDDWLIGPSSQTFWQYVKTLTPVFADLRKTSPSQGSGILIAEPDSLKFLAACLAAWAEGCLIVLIKPRWGYQERPQAEAMVAPDWHAPAEPDWAVYPCWVPGGAPGQVLIPTGGSSGQIKFVVHTWATLTTSVQGFCAHFAVETVHAYCVLPLFHVSGFMQVLRVLTSGGCLVVQPYGDLKAGVRLSLPPGGFLSLVPTQLRDLLSLKSNILWLQSFRAVLLGGAPAGRSLLDQAQAAEIPIALTYGMTETAAQVATLLPKEFLAGHRSCGRLLPHVDLTILNEWGQPQPAGQPGQIAIRSNSLARGYLCSKVLHRAEDSLPTDDIGYLDRVGYLHIVGRSSSKIITGGENVFPEEIESVLLSVSEVSDVCVVGLPCDRWGQQLCALVVAEPPTLLHTLQEALRPCLAFYKLPKQWILVSAIPRTAQGKMSRTQTLAQAQQILGMDC